MKSDTSSEQTWLVTGSLMVIAVVALGFTLRYARPVLVPFVLAFLLYTLVSPILDLQVIRLKVPRPVAVGITLLIVLAILGLILVFVNQAVQAIVSMAGRYSDSMVNLVREVFSDIRGWGIELDPGKIISDLQERIPKLVGDTFGAIMGFSSALLFVVIFLMFLLIGRKPRVVSSGIYKDVDEKIRKYIGTKAVISMATGLLVWVALSLFGLELAGVFGIFAFLLNFIPSIGSIIATLLPIPIAVAQFENPWLITAVVLVPGAIQMSIGNVIEPKLMGEGLQLHPVVILLALSFWGLLWGVVGMFLAVPMTAIIRIVLMQFETLRPVGRLLAGELPGVKE